MIILEIFLLLVFVALFGFGTFSLIDDLGKSGTAVIKTREFRLNIVAVAFSVYLVAQVIEGWI